jgi:hypothetical protein
MKVDIARTLDRLSLTTSDYAIITKLETALLKYKHSPKYLAGKHPPQGKILPKGKHGKSHPAGKTTKHLNKSIMSEIPKHIEHFLENFTEEDYDTLNHGAHKPKSKERRTLAEGIRHYALAIPKLVVNHGKEEYHNFVHAAHALNKLAHGHKPNHEEMQGLRRVGTTIVASAAMASMTGEPTGGAIGVIGMKLGEELVKHSIIEHGAKLAASVGRHVIHELRSAFIVVAVRTPKLSQQDIANLQAFFKTLADVVESKDIPTEVIVQALAKANIKAKQRISQSITEGK